VSQAPSNDSAPEAGLSEAQQRERAVVAELVQKPLGARLRGYVRLTGPGWLQSAITLGGGSLASSLFLGALAGFSLMWLQPVAMVLGIVMLGAIGYVTLSTGQRPFQAINQHVNPVLGWGWALATAMANIVWCLPQFSLGTASVRHNLLPSLLGPQAMANGTASKAIAAAAILAISVFVIWFYDRGGRGIKIFEGILKVMVGIVILCFFGVVVKMSMAGVLDWGAIGSGCIPRPSMFVSPAPTFDALLSATGPFAGFWSDKIVYMQRDVMISAAATAVGINMTFLLPYSMLAKGWNRNFRGLAIFDLSTGLFIPFILATGCVVIASASQFHAQYHPGLLGEAYKMRHKDGTTELANVPEGQTVDEATLRELPAPGKGLIGKFTGLCDARIKSEMGAEAFAQLDADGKAQLRKGLPIGDKRIAATLIKRSAFDLAASLKPLTGDIFSHYIFGIGVLGMAISSIIILMLISGFVVCEMLGVPPKGNAHRLACLLPAIGVLGPFIWSGKAAFWLAVPTSVFGMVLAPIAYWTFFCLMNSRSLLGDNMPKGGSRVIWNLLMLIACGWVSVGAVYSIWNKTKWIGVAGVVVFIGLGLIVHIARKGKARSEPAEAGS